MKRCGNAVTCLVLWTFQPVDTHRTVQTDFTRRHLRLLRFYVSQYSIKYKLNSDQETKLIFDMPNLA